MAIVVSPIVSAWLAVFTIGYGNTIPTRLSKDPSIPIAWPLCEVVLEISQTILSGSLSV